MRRSNANVIGFLLAITFLPLGAAPVLRGALLLQTHQRLFPLWSVVEQPSTQAEPKMLEDPIAPADSPSDPLVGQCWHLRRIRAQEAWRKSTGKGVVVAIVDTGCDPNHPDLSDALIHGIGLTGDSGWKDEIGHGTTLAGIVAARAGNDRGVAGVAPDAQIMPIKVMSPASSLVSEDTLGQAIDQAISQKVDIILIGLGSARGGGSVEAAVRRAQEAGILVVAPAGSFKSNIDAIPAGLPGVLSVAGVDRADLPSWTTNMTGRTRVLAPGEKVPTISLGGGYRAIDGTSAAAAIVAGVAALLRSLDRDLSAERIAGLIEATSNPLPDPALRKWTYSGRVNADRAVQRLLSQKPDASVDRIEIWPRAPVAGQKAKVRVTVTGRGIRTANGAMQLRISGGAFADGSSVLKRSIQFALGERQTLEELFVVGQKEKVEAEAAVLVTGDANATNNVQSVNAPVGAQASSRLEIVSLKVQPIRANDQHITIEVGVANTGNRKSGDFETSLHSSGPTPKQLSSISLLAIPPMRKRTVLLRLELSSRRATRDLGPVLRVKILTGAKPSEPSDVVPIYINRPSLSAPPIYLPQYANVTQPDVIIDAPWRLAKNRKLPVMLASFDDLELSRFMVMSLDTAQRVHTALNVFRDGAQDGGASFLRPNGRRIPSALLRASWSFPKTYHIIALLPRSTIRSTGGVASLKATVRAHVANRFKRRPGGFRFSKTLRVLLHDAPFPELFDRRGSGWYYDPHTHTIAEWLSDDTHIAAKNLGGPIEMMKQSAWAMGILENPDDILDRIITTDHSFFYADSSKPPYGAPHLAGVGDEYEAYKKLFGITAGLEMYVNMDGFDVPARKYWSRHLLGYKMDQLVGGFQLSRVPAKFAELHQIAGATPKLEDAIKLVKDDDDAFSFAAHPLPAMKTREESKKGGFTSLAWHHKGIRRALSFGERQDQLVDTDGFVFMGLQWWNQRITRSQPTSAYSLRQLDPFGISSNSFRNSTRVRLGTPSPEWKTQFDRSLNSWLSDYVSEGLVYRFAGSEQPSFVRKVYGLAATDAHGDFNYTTDTNYPVGAVEKLTPLVSEDDELDYPASVNDNAWYIARTYTINEPKQDSAGRKWGRDDGLHEEYFAGRAQKVGGRSPSDQETLHLQRMRHGNSIMTDGPLPFFVVDGQTQFDSERLAYDDRKKLDPDKDSMADPYFNIDGRIGGWGKFDGQLTALVDFTDRPFELSSYAACGWANTDDFGGAPDLLEFVHINRFGSTRRLQLKDYAEFGSGRQQAKDAFQPIIAEQSNQFRLHCYLSNLRPNPANKVTPVYVNGAFSPHALVLIAKSKSQAMGEHVGITNPLYIAPFRVEPRGVIMNVNLKEGGNPPELESITIPKGGLCVRWFFSLSMNPVNSAKVLGLELKQLNHQGKSPQGAPAINLSWDVKWSDNPAIGKNSILTIRNASAFDIPDIDEIYQAPYFSWSKMKDDERAYTFVCYLSKLEDSHGNRLNAVAQVVPTNEFRLPQNGPTPSPKIVDMGWWGAWKGKIHVEGRYQSDKLEWSIQADGDVWLRGLLGPRLGDFKQFEPVAGVDSAHGIAFFGASKFPLQTGAELDISVGGIGGFQVKGHYIDRELKISVKDDRFVEGSLEGRYSPRSKKGALSTRGNAPPVWKPSAKAPKHFDAIGKLSDALNEALELKLDADGNIQGERTINSGGVKYTIKWNFKFQGSKPAKHFDAAIRAIQELQWQGWEADGILNGHTTGLWSGFGLRDTAKDVAEFSAEIGATMQSFSNEMSFIDHPKWWTDAMKAETAAREAFLKFDSREFSGQFVRIKESLAEGIADVKQREEKRTDWLRELAKVFHNRDPAVRQRLLDLAEQLQTKGIHSYSLGDTPDR